MRRHLLLPLFTLALAAVALGACGDDSGSEAAGGSSITISDAWSRQPAATQTVSAVYGVVSNAGDTDVTIVAATSPASDQVELHQTTMGDGGEMTMVEVPEGFVVPAGGDFTFEPGGPHVMMLGIDPATFPTDVVAVTFELDTGDTLSFEAPVRSLDGEDTEGMDMDGMDGDMGAGTMDGSGG